jgi:hypothetical protein
MFHIILIVKEDYYEKFESILQSIVERNLHYDKCIIYFDTNSDNYKNRLHQNILYTLNQNKMILYENKQNQNIQYVMSEIAHIYGGICTYLYVDKLNTNDFIPKIIDSIQHTLNHNIYIKSSTIIPFDKEEISDFLLEKTFYNQYKNLIDKNGYYEVSIISFNYQHTWIKKLFFELKYIENVTDLNYVINLLYYKYSNMYAKGLLA